MTAPSSPDPDDTLLRRAAASRGTPIDVPAWSKRLAADSVAAGETEVAPPDTRAAIIATLRGLAGESGLLGPTLRQLADRLAALDEPPQAWQPIATAPKNKILWLYDRPARRHYMGWWYPGGGPNGEGCFAYEGEGIGWSRRHQPTHWGLPTTPPRDAPGATP